MIIGNYTLLLDSLIIVLLIATVVYAMRLSQRLTKLRNNRSEMEKATRAFAEAAARADSNIKALKRTADELSGTLQKDIERARALRDELSFLVDAGESMANRLEEAASAAGQSARLNQSRAQAAASAAASAAAAPPPPPVATRNAPPDGGPAPRASRERSRTPTSPGVAAAAEAARAGEAPTRDGPARARTAAKPDAPDSDLLRAIENLR